MACAASYQKARASVTHVLHHRRYPCLEPGPGQAPSPMDGNALGGRPSQRKCHHRLCRHFWECGRDWSSLGALRSAGGLGLKQSPSCRRRWSRMDSDAIPRNLWKAGHFLCDFFHVSEYLAAAAPVCARQPDRWRRTQQKRLRRGATAKVIETLAEHLEPVDVCDEDAPVRTGHRYLSNRVDCLDYPEDRLGLPIGSGMIESGHRHVLHSRLKKAGTAWLRSHADDIAHLPVLRANGQCQSLWN